MENTPERQPWIKLDRVDTPPIEEELLQLMEKVKMDYFNDQPSEPSKSNPADAVLQTQLNQYEESELALTSTIQRLHSRLEAKEAQRLSDLQRLKDQLGQMNKQLLAKCQQKIDRYAKEAADLHDQLEKCSSEMTTLQTAYETLSQENTLQKQQITDLTTHVDQLQQEKASLEHQKTSLAGELTQVATKSEKTIARIELEKKMVELKVRETTKENEDLKVKLTDLQAIADEAVKMVENVHT